MNDSFNLKFTTLLCCLYNTVGIVQKVYFLKTYVIFSRSSLRHVIGSWVLVVAVLYSSVYIFRSSMFVRTHKSGGYNVCGMTS